MAQPTTVIQAGTVISGRIEGKEDLLVHGRISGEIDLDGGAIVIEATGRVDADLHVDVVEVHGVLVGTVVATTSIALHHTARVLGDLSAPSVRMADGAMLRGSITMDVKSAPVTAPRGRSAFAGRPTFERTPARPSAPMAHEPVSPSPAAVAPAQGTPTVATPAAAPAKHTQQKRSQKKRK